MQRYIAARIVFGVLLLFAVIFIIIRVAGSGSSSDAPEVETASSEEIEERRNDQLDSGSRVELKIVGEINAPENHREIHFSIDKNRRKVSVITGYDGEVLKSERLVNTEESFTSFTDAITVEGFNAKKEEPTITEPAGICSEGKQYFFSFSNNGNTVSDTWTTSCSRTHGTFGGDRNDVEDLFEAQFPEWRDFIRGIRL